MKIEVEPGNEGLRLDVFLTRALQGPTRTRLQNLIRAGKVMVNGQPTRSAARVTVGMEINLEQQQPMPTGLMPEDRPLDVLFEDSDIVALNKPAGITVHPAGGRRSGTLVNALLHHCRDLAGVGDELRPGIAHRLDSHTSGVMVVAKNDAALACLARQFKERSARKQYVAIVCGVPSPAAGRIDVLIGRNPCHHKKMAAFAGPTAPPDGSGKTAVSTYRVSEVLGLFAVVQVFPETGRTHQIRVHMAHIGRPVLGDRCYGGRHERAARQALDQIGLAVERQMLHAERIEIEHPLSGERMQFAAPLPDDMRNVIQTLRKHFQQEPCSAATGKTTRR
ncbi:MAG: RluA family pseudouridine synthase [Verrucomicrobiota bacterium]|nr:RluA family pseudouridine synthase [Verrucomicrobiota bacterium]